MNYRITGRAADANFVVESILSGAAPWLQLSSETTLEYAFFGGNSPFANWVGDDPYAWEAWPTSESLFLTNDLGEKIQHWVREFDRCAYAERRGLPATDESEFAQVAREGLRLAELIRNELPYYYVEATFFDSVPQTVIDQVDAEVPDRSGYRKLDNRTDVIGWKAMLFQPFSRSQMPPELSTLSAVIKANVERYGGHVVDSAGDIWRKLDAWQVQYTENFVGLPIEQGEPPRWQPGFDRLGWIAEGLALQHEAGTVLEGTHLTCGAAYLAISKDEWDSMLATYLAHPLPTGLWQRRDGQIPGF